MFNALTPQQNNRLCNMALYCLENNLNQDCKEPELEHFIHEGVYYRTCRIPKGVVIIGALVVVPTTVIVSGDCYVAIGDYAERIKGYQVVKAEANRRQAFKALEDTTITMCYRTDKTTVEDCEKEFTPEWKLLTTNREELMKEYNET